MIYLKDEKLKNISLSSNNFFVVIDFDRTMTTSDSLGSWGIFENSDFFPKKFLDDSKQLIETYYPYEQDTSLDIETKNFYLNEWYHKNMELFYQYSLTYSTFCNCINHSTLRFREGLKDFLNQLYLLKIPVIILSAGIGNVIVELLKKENCFFDNIFIESNFLTFDGNTLLPFTDEIIHTGNKSFFRLPKGLINELSTKEHILLFGDLIDDLKMVPKEFLNRTLSFGFLTNNIEKNLDSYLKSFDIVLTDSTSFLEVQKILSSIFHTEKEDKN